MKSIIKEIILNRVSLKSYYNYLVSRNKVKKEHVFIACLPKSGSTFLANALVNTTNFDFIQFQPVRGTNDHNLDPGVFLSSLNKNTVTQLHIKPNDSNRLYFVEHQIKIVFLYRDITSSLKSFYNHILNENDQWFMFTVARDFKDWDIEKQFDFLIDLVVPWYINFLTSWQLEIAKNELDIFELDYQEFVDNNESTIRRILEFYNLDFDEALITEGLKKSYDKKDTLRYNKDTKRVKYDFSKSQLDKIHQLVSYYPEFQIKI
ncbi:sulfotransferase domain-containing protein [Psychroserpens sp. BH13MA-6]